MPALYLPARYRAAGEPAYPNERPQYPALARAVTRAWNATREVFGSLKGRWLAATGQEDPELRRAVIRQAEGDFLRRFAGPDRTKLGFTTQAASEAVLQRTEFLAYLVGIERGGRLTNQPQNPEFTALQQAALLRDAFERLSENGRLRFEERLGEIRAALYDGFAAGRNPLELARDLGRELDAYEQHRLRMLIRTEAAFASEAAVTEMFGRAGMTHYRVLGDPSTDALCVGMQQGGPYRLADVAHRPPFHPMCFCTQVPDTDELSEVNE